MNQKKLKPHVEDWVKDGLLQPDQAEKILSRYPHTGSNYWVSAFIIIGSLLILGGIILVISSNWQDIPGGVKFGCLLLLLIGSTVLGVETQRRKFSRVWWENAYLAAAIFPLLGMGLVSQIFHVQGKSSGLMLAWVIATAPLPLLTRSLSTWVVQILAFMSLFICLKDEKFLGTNTNFESWCVSWMVFGVILVLVSKLWLKVNERVQHDVGEFWGILMFFVAAYTWGLEEKNWQIIWLCIFLAAMALIYRGYLKDKVHQVNIGFVMVALILLSVFIRVANSMFNTGLFFILGGLIIVLTVWGLIYLRNKLLVKKSLLRGDIGKDSQKTGEESPS